MQGKYYENSDIVNGVLHTGMRVSLDSLDKIVGVRILLNAHTLEIEDGDVKSGEIVFIGRGDYKKEGLSVSDILPVYNYIGGTDSDYIFEV